MSSTSLGDSICATPILRALHRNAPHLPLDVYTYQPDLFRYSPNVSRVYRFDEELELNGTYGRLRAQHYADSRITFFSTVHKPPVDYYGHSIVDTCALIALGRTLPASAHWLEVPTSDAERSRASAMLSAHGVDPRRAVVIHPSATWPTRTWPAEHWQVLTDMLLAQGYAVVAVGERQPLSGHTRTVETLDMLPCPAGAVDLTGQLSVLESAALLALCHAVITADTGILHLALTTDTNVVGIFTVVHPRHRQAVRSGSFDHKFAAVPPAGECHYCALTGRNTTGSLRNCPRGYPPPCMPGPQAVFDTIKRLETGTQQPPSPLPQGVRMPQNIINPDAVCQQALQAKLSAYQAKEQFESVLKQYNDQVDNLINLVGLMKNRILELEAEAKPKEAAQ
jgi:ADP-heptose:LPS heptosyltransferase